MSSKRTDEAARAAIVEQWRQSGLSMPRFCQARGLNYYTFKTWVYKPSEKLRDQASVSTQANRQIGSTRQRAKPALNNSSSPRFVPVEITNRSNSTHEINGVTTPAAIEVILRCRRRLVVGEGFDPETLRRLILLLESDC